MNLCCYFARKPRHLVNEFENEFYTCGLHSSSGLAVSFVEVETIFDHSVTEAEQVAMYGAVVDKERHIKMFGQEVQWFRIHRLFKIRGDVQNALLYKGKLSQEFVLDAFHWDVIGCAP